MKQLLLIGGPFTGRTAESARLDGALRRFVMLWRLDNTFAGEVPGGVARPEVKDWACLYHLDGRFDVTLEDEAARPFFERGTDGARRWKADHDRRAEQLAQHGRTTHGRA